jgi:hypothetical protein
MFSWTVPNPVAECFLEKRMRILLARREEVNMQAYN